MSSSGAKESHYYEDRPNNEIRPGEKKVNSWSKLEEWANIPKGKQHASSSVAAVDGSDTTSQEDSHANERGDIEKLSHEASPSVGGTHGGFTKLEEEGVPGVAMEKEEGHTLSEWKNIIPKVEVHAPTTVAATDGGDTDAEASEYHGKKFGKKCRLQLRLAGESLKDPNAIRAKVTYKNTGRAHE